MKPIDEKTIFEQPDRLKLKTYSHLSSNQKLPSMYELLTSGMLYYPEKGGFEVKTPIADWYHTYQQNSDIKAPKWENFEDPLQNTYNDYVQRQKDEEVFLNAHAKHIDASKQNIFLDEDWMRLLSLLLGSLRYPWHGFQMISAYLGSMAPEGKIVMTFAFQTMDEMRRIQRIAYRLWQLQQINPELGKDGLQNWQEMPMWQPLRRGIEQMLITYDWLEAFVALNICFKPVLDRLILIHFNIAAKNQDDSELAMIFRSLWEDASWQQQWSLRLLDLLLKADKNNKIILRKWWQRWFDRLLPAVLALEPLFLGDYKIICNDLFQDYEVWLNEMDLDVRLSWR